ncbi:hypothetical protein [Massilia yuzhufengensis]|uniref:Lipoprotein n=1 Tax=Massilia yuzhufengensis TaxID=1164594 RepID=A0A1I1MVG0_9BURK|nr:hypothetical protein [Massilia yuzhufengensis]SFC86553.1 hypothetical protein SAMN05216204_11187 [Massilia yuzhufengensis]
MNKLAIGGVLLAAALAGCAAPPQAPDVPTEAELIANAGNTAGQDGHQMTGSRIKGRSSTDRMLKAVGAQGARDELRNAARPGALVE